MFKVNQVMIMAQIMTIKRNKNNQFKAANKAILEIF